MEETIKVKWKTGVCGQGEKCWCRTISPVDPILDEEQSEMYIVGQGEMSTFHAEYIVNLHNKSLENEM
tara:strand:+ start:8125 stop:8328 length:204 start_codon:yes stop_codon:yes gene_type:complete